MAILKGLTVWIEVNGISLHEYRDPDCQEFRLDSVSRYIQAFSGTVFAIRVSIPKIFAFTSDALGVFLYLDGTYVEGGIFEKGLHDYRFEGTFGVGERGFGYKEFTFNEIKLEEPSTSKPKDPGRPNFAELGTIAVKVFRMRIVGPRIREGGSESSVLGLRDELQVSEKDLKGRSVTHNAKLGYSSPGGPGSVLTVYHRLGGFKPSAGRDAMRTEHMDGENSPLAVFKFKYCSREALQGLLLIPRTPSPRTEALNAVEKDELVRRQQARSRVERKSRAELESGVKIERGIKRERDEEYDEMMASASAKKVKGPIANGETVELSDED